MADYAHNLTEKQLAELEGRIYDVYEEAGREIGKTIDDYFEKFAARDEAMKDRLSKGEISADYYKQWRLNQIGRGGRFVAMRDKVAERMTDANGVARSYVQDATPGVYSLNRNYAAYAIEKVSDRADFTLWDEATVRKMIVEQPETMPYYSPTKALERGIDLDYGKKQIKKATTSAILQGKSIKGIADDLQTKIMQGDRTAAIRAARTSVTSAQNAGRMDTYAAAQKMGIKLKKRWLATLDGRTRHAHQELDGHKPIPYDEPFKVDGHEIMYPGDPSAEAYLVWNCRCTLIAEVEGVDTSDAQRRARDLETGEREIVSDMTYNEWMAAKRGETSATKKYQVDSLHPESLGGVSRTAEQMTFDEADTGRVNPNYGTERGYSINCQSCVVGFEARQRGYDVQVLPNNPGSMGDQLSRNTRLAWIDPITGEAPNYILDVYSDTPARAFSFIDDTVKQGERYTLQFSWKSQGRGTVGHIINLDRTESGQLRLKDNQRGDNERSEWTGEKDIKGYLKNIKYITSRGGRKYYTGPRLLRVDNMEFNQDVVNKILEGGK